MKVIVRDVMVNLLDRILDIGKRYGECGFQVVFPLSKMYYFVFVQSREISFCGEDNRVVPQ
jgi:hypothetical protein